MSKRAAVSKSSVVIGEMLEPVLSRKHESVVVALLSNPTIKEAAASAGVNESTVWRLMQREDFQKRYKAAQNLALDGALGTLQGAATAAIDSLLKNVSCGVPAVEVSASRAVLEFTLKAREQFDYAVRIARLEAALKAREDADGRGGDEDVDEH